MLGPLMPGFEARWHLKDSEGGLLFVAQFIASVMTAATVGELTPFHLALAPVERFWIFVCPLDEGLNGDSQLILVREACAAQGFSRE